MLFKSLKAQNVINFPSIGGSKFTIIRRSMQKWDLMTAVCVERRPIITPELNKIEKDFQKLLMQLEFEHSLKSDHEMRHEGDVRQAALMKSSKDIDIDLTTKQTAQDYEDAAIEELSKFKFAPKTTESDKLNGTDTLNGKLDKHLLLLVEQKVGKKTHFLPPQGILEDGETLRQTAERVLKQVCGNEIKAQFYGNAPSGFYKYKYPLQVQKNGTVGAKIFIYWAKYMQGTVDSKQIKFHWLDKQEIGKFLPPMYHNAVSQFLLDDNH